MDFVFSDPLALLNYAVLVFAASMYPLGLLFGAPCSNCCCAFPDPVSCDCDAELPDTVTLSFYGFENVVSTSTNALSLSFSSNFGSGAAGTVTGPTNTPGPLVSVQLTNGGSGYARTLRLEPTVTAAGSGGSGATLAVSLSQLLDDDGREVYEVSSVSVTAGGSGYTDGDAVTFSVTSGEVVTAAVATISTKNIEPSVSAAITGSANGTGAVLSVVFDPYVNPLDGKDRFEVESITIEDGGEDYAVSDSVAFTIDDGTSDAQAAASVSSVDGNGAITGISIDAPGSYWKTTTQAGHVVVTTAGVYFKDDLVSPGEKADITVTVVQAPTGLESSPSGASVTPTIEDDPQDADFGKIVSLTLASAGNGYVQNYTHDDACCAAFFSGNTMVLSRTVTDERRCAHITLDIDTQDGSGACLEPVQEVINKALPLDQQTCKVASIAIRRAGISYEVDDVVLATVIAGVELQPLECKVASVSASGGVLSVSITDAGEYYSLVKGCEYEGTACGHSATVVVNRGGTPYEASATVSVAPDWGCGSESYYTLVPSCDGFALSPNSELAPEYQAGQMTLTAGGSVGSLQDNASSGNACCKCSSDLVEEFEAQAYRKPTGGAAFIDEETIVFERTASFDDRTEWSGYNDGGLRVVIELSTCSGPHINCNGCPTRCHTQLSASSVTGPTLTFEPATVQNCADCIGQLACEPHSGEYIALVNLDLVPGGNGNEAWKVVIP